MKPQEFNDRFTSLINEALSKNIAPEQIIVTMENVKFDLHMAQHRMRANAAMAAAQKAILPANQIPPERNGN